MQPYTECFFTVFAVTFPAIFIGNMPCNDIVIIFVSLCQFCGKCHRIFPVSRAVRTGIVTCSEFAFHAVMPDTQDIRVFSCHPRRMRSCRSCKADFQSVFFHILHDLIQFGKIIGNFIRLQCCPAENIERHDINVR